MRAQGSYQVVSVPDGGTISGTVTWSGPQPRLVPFPITKDIDVCDPNSRKKIDLERLVIGPAGGVANTVVYLKDVSHGKAMDLPEPRRSLDQKNCRYWPHVLLVPENGTLQMVSSDPVLHNVHMDGASTFNLPFPFRGRVQSQPMPHAGISDMRCNGGHLWMNGVVVVAPHPYYAVTDAEGVFTLTGVPPGRYEIVAWHEGWSVAHLQDTIDVSTSTHVERPVFSLPKTWEKDVVVAPNATVRVDFTLSQK